MLKGRLYKCDVYYQQFECERYKYFTELLEKIFFATQLLAPRSDIYLPDYITAGLQYIKHARYRARCIVLSRSNVYLPMFFRYHNSGETDESCVGCWDN